MPFNPFLPLAGLIVGIIVGMTGVGGGSLMTPALIFGLGVPAAQAVGTDLIFAGITKSLGVWRHRAARNIDWGVVTALSAGSLPATVLSVVVLDRFASGRVLDFIVLPVLGSALFLTALVLVFRDVVVGWASSSAAVSGELSRGWIVAAGAVVGVLVTVSSVGAGALGVTVLTVCRPLMPTRRIVGSDLAHALPLALVAGAGHWHLDTVDGGLLVALLMGSLPGIYIGSVLAGRIPERVLRTLLALVLTAAAFMCFYSLYRQ